MSDPEPGILTLAGTPLGQPGDAAPRLAEALAKATVVAAEDTKRVRRLAAALGVQLTATILSYWDEVEAERADELVSLLRQGHDVLVVTDAGMPGISDPGYRVVAAAVAAGIRVTVLPGPSAVTAALAVSGLPTNRFCFEGYPPRKAGDRARRFAELATERRTMVLFESPRRTAATLAELAAACGAGRRAVVCRELTKTYEEIRRGTLAELAGWAGASPVLGEITLVIEGARDGPRLSPAEAAGEVARRVAAGEARNAAIAAVARESGLRRGEVYDAVLAARRAGQPPAAGPVPPG